MIRSRVSRAAVAAAAFVAGLVAGVGALRGVSGGERLSAHAPMHRKLAVVRATRPELVVVGSSYSHRGVDPKVVGRALQAHGVSRRVYNLSAGGDLDVWTDGLSEELIGQLGAVRELGVIARTSVMRFRSATVPISEIAKALGVPRSDVELTSGAGNRNKTLTILGETSVLTRRIDTLIDAGE